MKAGVRDESRDSYHIEFPKIGDATKKYETEMQWMEFPFSINNHILEDKKIILSSRTSKWRVLSHFSWKNEKLESFKLKSLTLESFCLSWKEPSEVGKNRAQLESLNELGKLSRKSEDVTALNNQM